MPLDANGWPIGPDGRRLANYDLYAGSPMYFPCATPGCPRPVVMPENYMPPRDQFCSECHANGVEE